MAAATVLLLIGSPIAASATVNSSIVILHMATAGVVLRPSIWASFLIAIILVVLHVTPFILYIILVSIIVVAFIVL